MSERYDILVDCLRKYRANLVDGRVAVAAIDRFVSEDSVFELTPELRDLILVLQDQAALYVPNPDARKEYSGYIGEQELRRVVIDFLKKSHS